jgi:hypothetical protein
MVHEHGKSMHCPTLSPKLLNQPLRLTPRVVVAGGP